MRLSLLEERESVIEIIIETLNEYYSGEFEVSLNQPNDTNDYLTFYGNKYLNFFAAKECPSSNFEVIKREYANSNKIWKKSIQEIYVLVATSALFYCQFYHYKFYITSKQKHDLSNWLFMGGNSRLRIIEAKKNQTHVILKKGYPDFFIKNEIQHRSNGLASRFFPQLISHRKLGFTESLHPGIPINRLAFKELIKYRKEAFEILKKELQENSIQLDATYFRNLINSISAQLSGVELEKHMASFDFFDTQFLNQGIPVTLSHGDFQDANILSTEGGLKIIDWESVMNRSVFYDQITLLAATRSGFEIEKIKEIIEKIDHKCGFSEEQIFYLFLLEELHYRLSYLPLYQKNKTRKQAEISKLIKILSEIRK